jgi:hypothetical protein
MSAATTSKTPAQLHDQFLRLVPRIERHARFIFRQIPCAVRREDAIQECRALAWKWFVRLHERGKNIDEFAAHFVALVSKAVKSGRRLTGMVKLKDVMSERCQAKRGFTVESLQSTQNSIEQRRARPSGQKLQDAFEEHLTDNATTPVPEQVAFRLDWPSFFSTLTQRDRRLAEFLALGNIGKHAAAKFNLSPGRVTQLRQRWCQEWRCFEEDDVLV